MAIKKSELYGALWKGCDALRGGMDASQYKDYVLVLLFVKYISDKYAGQKDGIIEVPKGSSFNDMVALKGKADIGEKLNIIIAKLAEANHLKGVIDVADFNDSDKLGKGKDMVERLSGLVGIFEELDFSKNKAEGDDLLGDAYEYLMRNFATESGKSKGQFYTPAEVSRIMAKVIGVKHTKRQDQTIYDPTCGSGSLLLKVADEAERGISIYGQENDNATRALAVMNMWLHSNPSAEIWKDNTLAAPHFKDEKTGKLKTFDFVVANPPFSTKAWTNGVDVENDPYERFSGFGIPPTKNGDYAFLLHIVRSLKSTGKGAIILPHGVLFRGNAEAEIRTNLIRKGYIKGIIGLPANLFYGTGIPACIIVLDKENAASRKGIFMIDASKGFMKDGPKNRLREQDLHKIVDVFNNQLEVEKYSRMVPVAEIEAKEFNLNIPRYIDSQEPEDIHDIEAHLLGDIPNTDIEALRNYWQVYPTLEKSLFAPAKRSGYYKLAIAQENIKTTIFGHPEFTQYSKKVDGVFAAWKAKNKTKLNNIAAGDKPKRLIQELSENLLESFSDLNLIDKYDIYQNLMVYWANTMQDDVFVLVSEGWAVGKEIAAASKGKEFEGLVIPKALIIARYFAKGQAAIKQLETECDGFTRQMEELAEEHGVEEGLLEESQNEKGKVTKILLQKRLKDIKKDADAAEVKVIAAYLALIEQEAEANRKIKDAHKDLDDEVLAKYKALTVEEIKTLLVEDKWLAAIALDVKSEMDRINQRLTQRIKELAERYAVPLPVLTTETDALTEKVTTHLKEMGFTWK